MCHRENLYQIDLLNGSKNRVTEREYWAKRKGQAALDKENASLAATGEPPKLTKFETDKEKLRRTIRAALSSAVSFEDFSGKLLQQGVTVKESRGRLSYLTPDRTKPITARKLGDDFDRAAVLEKLTINAQNAARAAEIPAPKEEYSRSIKDRLQLNKAAINAPKQDSIQRMVDREAKRAEGKGIGYDRWAAVHNLKQMAATMSISKEKAFVDETNKVCICVEETEEGFFLKTNLYDYMPEMQNKVITTEMLGMAFEPEQKFENPDGSPIVFDEDYYGNAHGKMPKAGPFEEPGMLKV